MPTRSPEVPPPLNLCNPGEIAAVLREISPTQLRHLGATQIAYAIPVLAGTRIAAYSVHAADGTPLAMVDSLATAAGLAAERCMILLPVN